MNFKNLQNLKGVHQLSKDEQRSLVGGAGGKYTCEEIWAIPLCCHPNWTTVCGFTPPSPGMCNNGVCIM